MNYNNYNPYMPNTQYYSPYGQTYQNMQMPQRQMQPQQPMHTEDVPFNEIKFVTEDEAKAYIVMPNTKVMLMDRDKSVFYIKSADSLGKSTLEGFKYTKLSNNSNEDTNGSKMAENYVKNEDLKVFATKDELKGFVRPEDLNKFSTKDDIQQLNEKIEKFQKDMVEKLLKGEPRVAKQ